MRHFHRTHVVPADALAVADAFFPTIGMQQTARGARERTFTGALGTLHLTARPEGGHYTFVEARTDQMGESRLDRNVKRYFVEVHRKADPAHALHASY